MWRSASSGNRRGQGMLAAVGVWLLVGMLVLLPAVSLATLMARAPSSARALSLGLASATEGTAATSIATPTPTAGPRLVAGPGQRGPARVLFIGDSLTGGYYASDWAHSFPALVAARLGARIVHGAIYYGHTAVNTIEEMNVAAPPAVDLAVIELGVDDMGESTLPVFQVDYGQVLARLRRANPRVVFVCLGLWQDPGPSVPWNAVVRQWCAKIGGHFYDLGPLYVNEAYHGPQGRPTWVGPGDWFHPNDAGHAAIAAAVLHALGIKD